MISVKIGLNCLQTNWKKYQSAMMIMPNCLSIKKKANYKPAMMIIIVQRSVAKTANSII